MLGKKYNVYLFPGTSDWDMVCSERVYVWGVYRRMNGLLTHTFLCLLRIETSLLTSASVKCMPLWPK